MADRSVKKRWSFKKKRKKHLEEVKDAVDYADGRKDVEETEDIVTGKEEKARNTHANVM